MTTAPLASRSRRSSRRRAISVFLDFFEPTRRTTPTSSRARRAPSVTLAPSHKTMEQPAAPCARPESASLFSLNFFFLFSSAAYLSLVLSRTRARLRDSQPTFLLYSSRHVTGTTAFVPALAPTARADGTAWWTRQSRATSARLVKLLSLAARSALPLPPIRTQSVVPPLLPNMCLMPGGTLAFDTILQTSSRIEESLRCATQPTES